MRGVILVLVLVLVLATPATGNTGCELEVQLVAPLEEILRGEEAVGWTVRFANQGDGECGGSQVRLVRHEPRGLEALFRSLVGVQALPRLAPGERATLVWEETEPPRVGTYRYRFKYDPKPETRGEGHKTTWDVVFTMSEPGGVCDLAVAFDQPRGDRLRAEVTVNIKVRFENVGRGDCEAISLRLARQGDRYGHVEEPGGTRRLPALAPGDSHTLSWREKEPPSGEVTYSIDYWDSFSDDDVFNHRPRKRIRFR